MQSDEEIKFAHMVNFIYSQVSRGEEGCATFGPFQTNSQVRMARRRLYYLREKCTGELRQRADKLAFKINGRVIVAELLPDLTPTLVEGDSDAALNELPPTTGD